MVNEAFPNSSWNTENEEGMQLFHKLFSISIKSSSWFPASLPVFQMDR